MEHFDIKTMGDIPCFHLEEEIEYSYNKKWKRARQVLADLERNHNHSWYRELSLRATHHLDQSALFYRGTMISYREMLLEADKLASALKSLGVCQGDEIPICFNNIPELVYLMLAINKLGAKINSFDSGFDPDYISEILSGCSKKICIATDYEYLKVYKQIQSENFERIVIVAVSRSLPEKPENCDGYEMEAAKLYEIDDMTEECLSKFRKCMTYDSLLSSSLCIDQVEDDGKLDTEFLVTYTSGTTKLGFPKAVIHTNRSLIVSGRFHDPSASGNPKIGGLRCLAMIPPSHNTDLITCISDYLMQGWIIALEPYNRPEQALDYLMINKPNYANMVSNYWSEAARQYMCGEKYVGRKMGFLFAPFSVGERLGLGEERYLNIFLKKVRAGSDVHVGFFRFPYVSLCIGGGDCEHGGIYYTLWRSLFSKLNFFKLRGKQIGMLPEKYVVVTALKKESGIYKECRKNELGIIVANSASTFKGYKNNSEETAKRIIRDENGRTWVSCDVLGFIDRVGGIHVKGRVGGFMFVDGKKIYPHMIDEIIEEDIYNIMVCITVFRKDGRIVANILKSPRSKYSVAELHSIVQDRCRKKTAKAVFDKLHYRIFENIMDLPLTESGKRNIRALEEMEVNRTVELSKKRGGAELTGFPSIDKPWLKYYRENAEKEANEIPENKTVWDVIEDSLKKHMDIPAIEYFGKVIARKEFIENVYLWAKAFKKLEVKEDEIVAYYGPFMPDVCYMIFALNMIGACPYFLKLAIGSKALEEEAKECRIAIVFDQMWENVKGEFTKDKYEKVIIAKITDAMPTPKKQIVSVMTKIGKKSQTPRGKKYISVPNARELGKDYNGKIKAPFVSNRNAFITSSSGTTVGGIVKGVVATNETVNRLIYSEISSDIPVKRGNRVLNHFPPTAATSMLSLFLLPLFVGGTIVMDPRVDSKSFYYQITKLKPNVVVNTGSAWEMLFNRIIEDKKTGKKKCFNYATYWIIGGEGADIHRIKIWNEIITETGGQALFSGYGQSELFSTVAVENPVARYDFSKKVMSVGIPMAGITVGVFNKEGKELGYNQRGELRVKAKSAMKGYYNKPELTAQTKVDGWIHTGDLAEIDENGFVYIWGRLNDAVETPDGRNIYLFDMANKIKEKEYIDDAIVLDKSAESESVSLVAHIVWDKSVNNEDKERNLIELAEYIKQYEPSVNLNTFAVHEVMLPYSPTTLKKDKNRMANQKEGFVQVIDGKVMNKLHREKILKLLEEVDSFQAT